MAACGGLRSSAAPCPKELRLFPPATTGILIYEMLAGYPPFYDENPFGIYQKILQGKLEFPRHFETHARGLV